MFDVGTQLKWKKKKNIENLIGCQHHFGKSSNAADTKQLWNNGELHHGKLVHAPFVGSMVEALNRGVGKAARFCYPSMLYMRVFLYI